MGTQILLEAAAEEDMHGTLLDLGCGVGVIGIVCSVLFDMKASAVDINPRAVELTEINSRANGADVSSFVSDGFSEVEGSFDRILTNPPIRAGKQVIYGMFEDARAHLNPGGFLLAVIRRKQGAESAVKKLNEVFGNCTVVARDKGYWVLKAAV